LLAAKMKQHNARVWLVNTGWSGGGQGGVPGGAGSGKRIKLAATRAILDAIHAGTLADAPTKKDPVFGFDVVTACPGVSPEILWPRDTWSDPGTRGAGGAYDAAAKKLAGLFVNNFKQYEAGAGADVRAAGPRA
jgi:phosphoenolpyruvate carboxykinase (ATP)